MTADDVRRFLLAAQAGGFSTYGRLEHDDDLELAVAAYSLALSRYDLTVAELLEVLIEARCTALPSAGELVEHIYNVRNRRRRAQAAHEPALPSAGGLVPPSRGWLIARDAYLAEAQQARTPTELVERRVSMFEDAATRNASPADALDLRPTNRQEPAA